MVLSSVDFLVDALRDTNLLRKDQFDRLISELAPKYEEPADLAKQLVKLSWLTLYQAKKLVAGHGTDLVIGNYVVLDKLGEGGMGKVYKARQLRLNRLVALKVIRPDLLNNEMALKRFRREAKAAAQLSHSNIVRLYDADQHGDRHFLAMELVEGVDLACLVKDTGPLPIEMASSYIRQAASGLQHAHEKGLIHRDIKPSNLLVTSPGQASKTGAGGAVKILDMGLARLGGPRDGDSAETALTQDGTVIGTPDYMSPEQAKNSSTVDARSDLYSLGCTYYFLLTGQVPFPTGTTLEKLLQHQIDAPKHVQLLRPDIPNEVAAIVHTLLAKRPEDRFQNAAAVAEALQPLSVFDSGKERHRSGATPAVAVPQALPLSGTTEAVAALENDPFAFETTDERPPAIRTEVAHVPRAKPKRPMNWVVGAIAALFVLVVGIIIANSSGRSASTAKEKQADRENPEPRFTPRKTISSTARREMEPIDAHLPADTELVAILNVQQLQKSKFFQESLLHEIREPLEAIRNATTFNPLSGIERAIVALPVGDWDHPVIIVQGSDALPNELINWVASLPGVKAANEVLRGGIAHRIYVLPDKDEERNEPTYAAMLQTSPFSVVMSSKKERVADAIVRYVRKAEPRFEDPSVKTMLARYPAQPPALWLGLAVDTRLFGILGRPKFDKFVGPRDGNVHACYATVRLGDNLEFDAFVEADSKPIAEFHWRRICYFFRSLGEMKKDPRVERIAGLILGARELPRTKTSAGTVHQWTQTIPNEKLSDWFAPFFQQMPETNP